MNDATATLLCPVCGRPASDRPSECPGCGSPLSGYWRLHDLPLGWFNRAVERAAAGRVSAAARAAQAAVAIHPDHVPSRLLLARLLAAEEEWDEAIEHAQSALDLVPDSSETDRLVDALFKAKVLAEQEGGDE